MNCNNHKHNYKFSRRDFLTKTSLGLGALTLGSLISPSNLYSQNKVNFFSDFTQLNFVKITSFSIGDKN